jgi:hypothetical protein
MNMLGNGLSIANRHEDALSVREAELSMLRRIGASEAHLLGVQGNLASTYKDLGRLEEALPLRQEVYSGFVRIFGEEHKETLCEGFNYANELSYLQRFDEVKSLLRRQIPVAQRVLGKNSEHTIKRRWVYAQALYTDPCATLDDLREAVTTLEETERTARRVFGSAHPLTRWIEGTLRDARAALREAGGA